MFAPAESLPSPATLSRTYIVYSWAHCVHLHGSQDKLNREVDLYDHIDVVLNKETSSEADNNQENCWYKHSQYKIDYWPVQGHFHNDCIHVSDD